jgi:hypothetical protein
MPEDRSLDDFAGTENDDRGSDSTDAETGSGDGDVEPADREVEPAVETSTWHADGAECDRCGDRVERRWREEEALVCADCASW